MDDALLIPCEPPYLKGLMGSVVNSVMTGTGNQNSSRSVFIPELMVSRFLGPLRVSNVSNDQSVFQTNVWLNGMDMKERKCNNRLVRHPILRAGPLLTELTALSPWLRIHFSKQVDAVKTFCIL